MMAARVQNSPLSLRNCLILSLFRANPAYVRYKRRLARHKTAHRDTIMAEKKTAYSEESIRVLKGLEPVRQRPGVYTRTENPLHIVTEVIDNASDEAIGGYCHNISVTINADGSISVEDDGRGIPVGIRDTEEKGADRRNRFHPSAFGWQIRQGRRQRLCLFRRVARRRVYSVTNALSRRIEVTVWREKQQHKIAFTDGEVSEPLTSRPLTRGEKKSGTKVTIWPDARYFDSMDIPLAELKHLLQSKAILLPGVQVRLENRITGKTDIWQYHDGLRGYLSEALDLATGEETVIPLFDGSRYASRDEGFAEGEGAAWVVAWTTEGTPVRESFVNLIPTPAGGTHESGLRDGLFNAVRSFAEIHSLLPKGVRLLPEDVFARASFVLSARVLDPQFQGQIKERLNSRDAVRLVSHFVRPALKTGSTRTSNTVASSPIWSSGRPSPACGNSKKSKRKNPRPSPSCPASSPIANRTTSVATNCSLSKAIPQAVRRKWDATRNSRPSCPCAAKSSIPGKPKKTDCSPIRKSTTSLLPSVSIRMAPTTIPTCPDCVTEKSASSPMPTWTVRISRSCY